MSFRIEILLMSCLLLMGAARADGLVARLDRTQVAEGETLVLTLVASGDTDGTPDLSPLEADFDLLNQGQSTRVSIVNGRRSSTREWQLVLAPKRVGRLRIPVLSLGGLTSPGLDLEVLPQAQASKLGEARPLLLEVELGPEDPYVQGQIIYTVRVLARGVTRQASLSDPKAEHVLIERLGEDRSYTATRNGRDYQVIERRYALFPQHSGRLEIEPPVLSAQIPQSGRRGNSMRDRMFGRGLIPDMDRFFEQSRSVRLRGRTLSLDVHPAPAAAGAPWLPAESLELSQAWSPDPPEFRVGEPVTRSIAITAQGLTAAQLPDLQMTAPDGVKLYPDKPQSETRSETDTLVAQKVLKAAIVPSRPGRLILPELKLAWWDTRADVPRVATLPAQTVEVLPARAGSQAPAPAPAPVPVAPAPAAEAPGVSLPWPPSAQGGTAGPLAAYWPWISAALALAWLLTLALWLHERRRGWPFRVEPAAQSADQAPNLAKARERVHKACRAGDPRAARAALLDWAAARWSQHPPRRLDELAARMDEPMWPLLRELDRCLYAGDERTWPGALAWDGLEPALKAAGSENNGPGPAAALPGLYPGAA